MTKSRSLVPGRAPALGALRGPGEAGDLPARRPQLIEFAGDRPRRPAQAHRQQLSVPELGPLASEGIEIGIKAPQLVDGVSGAERIMRVAVAVPSRELALLSLRAECPPLRKAESRKGYGRRARSRGAIAKRRTARGKHCAAHAAGLRKGQDMTASIRTPCRVRGECSIEGCERPRHARGWCSHHWRRWSSKLGEGEDIIHTAAEELRGPQYGTATVCT